MEGSPRAGIRLPAVPAQLSFALLRRVAAGVLVAVALQGCVTLSGKPGIQCANPASQEDGRIAILSWNIHGLPFTKAVKQRMDNIADEILLCRPDVVLLQEAWLERFAERIESRLGSVYARIGDGAEVHRGLYGLLGIRRGGLLSFVRADSNWRQEPSGSLSLFTTYDRSAPWYRLSELDGLSHKGIQRFTLTDGRRQLVLINTHLQSQYGKNRDYEEVRESQIAQLVRESGASLRQVVVIAGDFNTNADERLHDTLVKDFRELTEKLRKNSGNGTHYDKGKESGWIDYIFLRRPVTSVRVHDAMLIVNSSEDDPYSDHHGVWIRLAIDP